MNENQLLREALQKYVAWCDAENNHAGTTFYERMDMCREAEAAARSALSHPAQSEGGEVVGLLNQIELAMTTPTGFTNMGEVKAHMNGVSALSILRHKFTTPPASKPAEGWEPIAEVHASWSDDEGFMIVRRLADRLPVGTKLYTAPPASKPADSGWTAKAWAEGYRQGVHDERISEANIGIAGFGAKVEPARQNPYLTTPPASQEQAQQPQFIDLCVKVQGGDTHTAQGEWMGEEIGYLVCVPREWQPQAQAQELPDERAAFEEIKQMLSSLHYISYCYGFEAGKSGETPEMLRLRLSALGYVQRLDERISAALAAKQERKPMTEGDA